jgi:hypothetical protein
MLYHARTGISSATGSVFLHALSRQNAIKIMYNFLIL